MLESYLTSSLMLETHTYCALGTLITREAGDTPYPVVKDNNTVHVVATPGAVHVAFSLLSCPQGLRGHYFSLVQLVSC